jgi:hypothetical protein
VRRLRCACSPATCSHYAPIALPTACICVSVRRFRIQCALPQHYLTHWLTTALIDTSHTHTHTHTHTHHTTPQKHTHAQTHTPHTHTHTHTYTHIHMHMHMHTHTHTHIRAVTSESTCPFYSFNLSARDGDAKICKSCTRCEDHSRFMREQLGSLDRDAMQG